MTAREPWAAKSGLRQALEEAIASYDPGDAGADPDGPPVGALERAWAVERDRMVEADPLAEPVWVVEPDRPVKPVRSTQSGRATRSDRATQSDRSPQPGRSAQSGCPTQSDRSDPNYLDQLLRLKADFENYRKRMQRDNEALALRAGEGVLESLLPVLDNMARALGAAEGHEEGQLLKGVELVAEQLRSVLAGHGLAEVPAAPGLLFDPTVHEAVVAQDSDEHPEGTIVTVLEAGYLLHGRLLRPARVIVAR